jgi:hypothetical protein
MSKTGQAGSVELEVRARCMMTSVSVIVWKGGCRDGVADYIVRPGHGRGRPSRLVRTRSAEVRGSHEGESSSRCGPRLTELLVAVGGSVIDPERDQRRAPNGTGERAEGRGPTALLLSPKFPNQPSRARVATT